MKYFVIGLAVLGALCCIVLLAILISIHNDKDNAEVRCRGKD